MQGEGEKRVMKAEDGGKESGKDGRRGEGSGGDPVCIFKFSLE